MKKTSEMSTAEHTKFIETWVQRGQEDHSVQTFEDAWLVVKDDFQAHQTPYEGDWWETANEAASFWEFGWRKAAPVQWEKIPLFNEYGTQYGFHYIVGAADGVDDPENWVIDHVIGRDRFFNHGFEALEVNTLSL